MASHLALLLTTLLIVGYGVVVRAEPITAQGVRPPGLRSELEPWRPVKDSLKHQYRLPPPTSAYYVNLGSHKKFFLSDPVPSNKVEVFAPAPPSIIGTFSNFGHETVKARHPVKHKKPFKETFQQAESRPGYPSDVFTPPHRQVYPQPFNQQDSLGQAYFFEASLSPPPRDSAINFVPPPSSKGLPPNSYYLQFDQQTRAKPTAPPNFSPYLRQNLPIYGSPDNFKTTSSSDHFRPFNQQPASKIQFSSGPTNSHGRPPGIDYFGNNPFGDIHLNTNRPETKTPAKDIFEQLSPLGRPFQSSTIEPLRFSPQQTEYSSLNTRDFWNSGNYAHQTTPRPFRPSPIILDSYPSTERPISFATPGPSPPSRELFPIPVTTLDIPSKDDFRNKPFVNTYQSIPETQQYHDEVTYKPSTSTGYRRPEVETITNSNNFYQPTPFLPTPSTDLDLFIGNPSPTELVTPSPDTNEVHKPTRTRVTRPRYRKKKPTRKPEVQQFIESTTDHIIETPINDFPNNDDQPLTTFETSEINHQSEQSNEPEYYQNRYEDKPKRRRPIRPNNYQSTSTFTNTESDIPDTPTDLSTLPQEDLNTVPPSSSTTALNGNHLRRRKKPIHRHRGSMRHGLLRSTSTTTTETPLELTSNLFTDPHTDNQNFKDSPTEHISTNNYSFDEYGHIVQTGSNEFNTLSPTQQIDDHQTNYQELITTTSTTTPEPTTTTTSTPETTLPSSTARTRVRTKYNFNKTRPRFSVKDYRERLNKATSTTTEEPKEEAEQVNESQRIRPSRNRGNVSYKQKDNQDDQVETSTRRFRPKYTAQRHAYRTSTTQSPLLQLDSPSTTERQNTFRPNSLRRPSPNKYYSRYRTSTEAPDEASEQPSEQISQEKLPQRPKGVFSAKKRRPFPLRTRVESATLPTEDEQSEKISEAADNDVEAGQYITKKSDNIATTTLMTSSEETDWAAASSSTPEVHTMDSIDQGEITKKIADLTSSPSNSFDTTGFFKGVSPSSRRTVSQITLATEDPILPIEAFFSSSFNKNNDSR